MNKNSKTKKATKKTTTPKAQAKHRLGTILGFSAISAIRAMGKAGWDYETAEAALKKAGIKAATRTIKNALRRGKQNDGTRKIATLTAKQLAGLKA